MSDVERIEVDGELLAMVFRADLYPSGVRFFTPDDYPMQVGLLGQPAGTVAAAHVHPPIARIVDRTLEVLHVRSGRIEVTLFHPDRKPAGAVELAGGDTILLIAGGHGVRMIEDSLILEIRQGPYMGSNDKVRFVP
jgi:hypothetical protein